MKLSLINEVSGLDMMAGSGLQYAAKRMEDPNYPEKIDRKRPHPGWGNYQALPNKVRQRQFLGFGPGKDDNTGNVRPMGAKIGDDNDNTKKVGPKSSIEKKMEKGYRNKLVRRKSRPDTTFGV